MLDVICRKKDTLPTHMNEYSIDGYLHYVGKSERWYVLGVTAQ